MMHEGVPIATTQSDPVIVMSSRLGKSSLDELRVISLAVLHVRARVGASCFVLIASRVAISVVSSHVQTAFKGAVGG